MVYKNLITSVLVLAGILFFVSEVSAIPPGAVPPSALPGSGSGGTTYASVGCNPGYAYPKASPGLGNGPCATDLCMPNGHLNVAVCVPETVCAGMRGSPIKDSSGKLQGWGCDDTKYVCCVAKKNRCNDSSTEMNKVYVCATESQCTTGAGGTIYSGGPSGCNDKGAYPVCCELKDSVTDPQPSVGEPFIPLPAGTTGAGGGYDVKRRKFVDINAFCHTQEECSKVAGVGNWVSGQGCPKKGNTVQGYCMSPDPDYELQYPIGGVTTINGLKNFIGLIFNYGMGAIIIAAALLFMYGGFRYMFSAVANDIQTAKTIMVDSLAGLALGLGAYAILANINVNTTILRSYKVPMINRIAFINVLYCKDVNPLEGKSEVLFQDAGPPNNPINYDVKKGFTKKVKETECGREYFMDGGDSLSVCRGTQCPKPEETCMSCISGPAVPGCNSTSQHEYKCVDGSKLQIVGKVNATVTPEDVSARLYCVKEQSGKYIIKDSDDISGDAPIKTTVSSAGASSGYIGGYLINDIKEADVLDFDKKCKSDGGVTKMALRAAFSSGAFSANVNHIISKNNCGKDLRSIITLVDGSMTAYSTAGFNCIIGTRSYFTTFANAMDIIANTKSSAFKNSYVDNTWGVDEILEVARHKKVIQCSFDAIGSVYSEYNHLGFTFCSLLSP